VRNRFLHEVIVAVTRKTFDAAGTFTLRFRPVTLCRSVSGYRIDAIILGYHPMCTLSDSVTSAE